MTARRLVLILALALGIGLSLAGSAMAAGGNYTVVGGTAQNATQIRKALDASRFNWSLVREPVTIHVAPGIESLSTPGNIWLSNELLASGSFSWGLVQHEYAHQVDFSLFNDSQRRMLTRKLHATDWCFGVRGLPHAQNGCERFASTLAWAYWPDARNSLRPASAADESAAMAPARFRALLSKLLGYENIFRLSSRLHS
ncbi:MAG: hypothetical protein ABI896_10785 [Actinomycetota bacterium]